MFITHSLSLDEGSIELSSLFEKNEGYTMPWLSFNENGLQVDIWDNDYYLINEVYPWLCGEDSKEDFEILEPHKEELKELFDHAFKIKMLKK